ncbi:hypothetical protein MATR_03810 [Marivirga tractuosa]|uniref:Periplasmic binding protein n=1 Tax=Marivirga tractuosa (strain ATCC 23168 / DSM 4126 / NBRC 15989 / NCIMB 1408 / VKM B-1430 / H-43) TaxID=643867 RepID=E4TTS9_MARTH|nr:hypothetical protein [Marivirga tractuosa]ADR21984.1 periplasmic binding protein [Marivirga tractuosa DSM 4126]BDD13556.1 hypothetical protein MATR_03810 [Marivirga tractuosa]
MKNRLSTLALILLISSCGLVEVCTTCTEQNTQVSDEFCGSPTEVQEHEDELKEQGQAYNQDWVCTGS